MSHPLFIHVMQNGDVWAGTDIHFTPAGTVIATYRINSDLATQKLGTLSGTIGTTLALSNGTGKWGKEIK